ncbi:hypothetical protein [Pseudoalteromonas sp. Of7M-16]|uniref:hypothetical protein n=1 Tax=Pseudoalteromonas sp. Of7M-16 TaxID=2917756 RepID=UPI001EF409DB|nr:hypothetical protein [Pseudoalteromonas sp. Of7M-16]MCG7547866.1 hypothetical protein [Pseudoalteromonas sp. Of7M-16]
MKPSSMLIGLVAMITSFTSSAAVQGEYLKTSSWQLKYIDESRYVWIYSYEYGQRKFSPVCTDTSPRKVPGKLVGDVCYVEWAGQEYANNYFYVLRDTGYMQFTRLTRASEDRIIQTGVTTRHN